MFEQLRITVLADNYAAQPNLLAEYGLSMLIEADGRRILFDTGQGRILCANDEALGVGLSGVEAIVLSHGHFDHTGGLAPVLSERIFMHPAIERKYAKADDSLTTRR